MARTSEDQGSEALSRGDGLPPGTLPALTPRILTFLAVVVALLTVARTVHYLWSHALSSLPLDAAGSLLLLAILVGGLALAGLLAAAGLFLSRLVRISQTLHWQDLELRRTTAEVQAISRSLAQIAARLAPSPRDTPSPPAPAGPAEAPPLESIPSSTYELEQRKNLVAEIQRSAAERNWHPALLAAESLISRYAASPEADEIRAQIQTIRQNAEIQDRQEMELRIKGFLDVRNFLAAWELTQELLNRYPASPQATALRPQAARLEELARQQEPSAGPSSSAPSRDESIPPHPSPP